MISNLIVQSEKAPELALGTIYCETGGGILYYTDANLVLSTYDLELDSEKEINVQIGTIIAIELYDYQTVNIEFGAIQFIYGTTAVLQITDNEFYIRISS